MLVLAALLGTSASALAAVTDIANAPLASASSDIKPNIMFILDDSGSMNWDHMPDDASDGGSSVTFKYGFYGLRSNQCNGAYYNPAITYFPPAKADGTNYPAATFTGAWTNGFNTGAGTTNLNTSFKASESLSGDTTGQVAYFYGYSGDQDTPLEKNYISTTNTFYQECNSAAGVVPGLDVFTKVVVSSSTASSSATIVVGGSGSTSVSSIKVNSTQEIMSSATANPVSTTTSGLATKIADQINACTSAKTGNCTTVGGHGYVATVSASTITLTGTNLATATSLKITRGNTGTMTFTTTITPLLTAAQITNFANWYSYYRNRLLMMKSSATRAFNNIGDKYRVGFSTISYTGTDSTNNKFLQISDFNATQKASFYTKLVTATTSGSTPLRAALSKAGRMYAGKLLTGVNDPVQYSCQQNFAILSTDGYWNEGDGYKVDGSSAVGNQDGSASKSPYPMWDGFSGVSTTKTTYTRDRYTVTGARIGNNGNNCDAGKSRLQRQPQSQTCTITTTNGVDSAESCVKVGANADSADATWGFASNTLVYSGGSPAFSGDKNTCIATASVSAPAPNPTVRQQSGSPTITTGTVGGTSDTLADVSMYYYQTDLRNSSLSNCSGAISGVNVCENNVFGAGRDNNPNQHMTTFTIGMGVNGNLIYTEDYESGGSADYDALKQGTKTWPIPGMSGTSGITANVDDLWHAAINGRGLYFSATNPDSLISGIRKSLEGVKARAGAAAAAATSNLEPVAGDNFAFIALYRTVFWDGDLQAKEINPSTGVISPTPVWSAQPLLDARVAATTDTRTIYTFDSGTASKLKPFTWATLTASEQAHFNGMCDAPVKLTQCSTTFLSTPELKAAASGENLVKFIRGQDGNEDQSTNTTKLYRNREHVLGDMVNSQPVYVRAPSFDYLDANYDTFKTNQANRTAMVYVAVNDGMLHAFHASVDSALVGGVSCTDFPHTNGCLGTEKWAYIPPTVIPNLHKLGDINYSSNHQYYVDGSPTIVDICPNSPASCPANQWKTILVGGLNAGGRGYYAMDITDPAAPKALWNFTVANDADLGFSFGNPIVTKLKNGTWVVAITSGYNNVSPGDGKGYLYILNANTGALIQKIGTGAGSTTTPSGLSKINAWVDATNNNTAERFYGGDLLGNVWRFDVNSIVPPAGIDAFLLATVGQSSAAGVQPITTKPELSTVSGNAVIYVATGRYLGVNDLSDVSQQSIYAIKDTLTATGFGLIRGSGLLVEQTLAQTLGTNNEEVRKISPAKTVDWSAKAGWFIDLNPGNKSPGERVNVDMQLQLGVLNVAGNVPNDNACTVGGYAWLYYLDINTGSYLSTSADNVAGHKLSNNSMVAGMTVIRLESGAIKIIITSTDGTVGIEDAPTPPGGGGSARRTSWRELISQ